MARKPKLIIHSAARSNRPPRARKKQSRDAEPQFWQSTSVEHLAQQQGVVPCADSKELRGDFWPEAEDTDDFLSWLRQLRGHR